MKQVYEIQVTMSTRSTYGIVATSEHEARRIAGEVDFFNAGRPRHQSKLITDVRVKGARPR